MKYIVMQDRKAILIRRHLIGALFPIDSGVLDSMSSAKVGCFGPGILQGAGICLSVNSLNYARSSVRLNGLQILQNENRSLKLSSFRPRLKSSPSSIPLPHPWQNTCFFGSTWHTTILFPLGAFISPWTLYNVLLFLFILTSCH